MYLIGIDVGTTHTKIGMYRPNGEELFFRKFYTPFDRIKDGGELSGEVLIGAILERLKEGYGRLPFLKNEKGFLGISSLGETIIPVSYDNNTLSYGLIWYDRRTIPIYDEIITKIGKEYFIKNLLKNPGYFYSLNKILWFKNKNPALFEKTKWFLPISSYIAFTLTGDTCIDYSHAVRTMLFNPYNMDWDYKLMNKLGLSPGMFPPLCKSGTLLGKLTPKIKDELGIVEDVYVSSGGHDHLVAALYMGLFYKNILFNSSGTTESVFLGVGNKELKNPDIYLFLENGDITCHTIFGLYTAITSMGTGGVAFKWFFENLLRQDISYAYSLKYKENNLFFMPRLLEVHEDRPSSAFLYVSMDDDMDTLYSSLVESLVFELVDRTRFLQIMEDEIPSIMRVSGGPSENNLYNQLKSDLFEKNVEIPQNKEATLLGAALLGGIGGNIYRNYEEAHMGVYRVKEVFAPNKNPYLTEKFQKYRELKKDYDGFLLDH